MRDRALNILEDEMSENTLRHIREIDYLEGWIVDAMIKFHETESDVMNSILNDLQAEIDLAKKRENECSSKGYFQGVITNQASIRGLESAVIIVKKYCS